MSFARLKSRLARFRDDCAGSFTVEVVPLVPLIFLVLAGGYEYFEVHRYKAVREKATYTVADMISRETSNDGVTSVYLDNMLTLMNLITNDDGIGQMRISVVKYDAETDSYAVSWSHVRGSGPWQPLANADVAQSHGELPLMDDGEEVIVVETTSSYDPVFNAGLTDPMTINTRRFTAIRFAPQVCYEGQCGS